MTRDYGSWVGVVARFRLVINYRGLDKSTAATGNRVFARGEQVLREQLGGRRLRFMDEQLRKLAVKAKGLGHRAQAAVAMVVDLRPLAWHRPMCEDVYNRARQYE